MTGTRILVGTADGIWDAGTSQRARFGGREVRCLTAVEPGYLAIVDDREVWRCDGAGDWTPLTALETSQARCLCPTLHGLLIGASDAELFTLQGTALERVDSFDTVPGREDWHTPWGDPPDVRSITADPAGTTYVNVHVGGIARSTDGGDTWWPTIAVDADVHQVLYHAASGLLLAASAVGLGVSSDRGESWRFDNRGLHDTYLRAVAVARDSILVAASTGPSSRRGAVYRRPISGAGAFERCGQGLPEWFAENIDTHCLAAADATAAFGTSDGRVFATSDQGLTWRGEAEGLPRVLCVLIVSVG